MSEEFLQYIWQQKLFNTTALIASTGETVEVINVGEKNTDSGPDFFNAKIKINDTLWAGNVEIHLNSSDWHKHHHHNDKSYDNVVLHVVHKNDDAVKRTSGEIIPTIELAYNQKLLDNYQQLQQNQYWIACQDKIRRVDGFTADFWLNKLLIERLEGKSQVILQSLEQNKNNWEETFYQQIAKSFGAKVNATPFEMLAKSLSLIYLAKHKSNQFQIEALLFGQAGMLEEAVEGDNYYQKLQKEYRFLKQKFSLQPIEKHLWKFLRLRPANFPTIRIAQLAQLIYNSTGLFSKIIQAESIAEIEKLFQISTSPYWETHYTFGNESKKRTKSFGKTAFYSTIINTIIPFLFVYGDAIGDESMKDKAFKWLEALDPEKNAIIGQWRELGFDVPSAFYSQAFLQLKNEYCNKRNCLRCQIGNKIITL